MARRISTINPENIGDYFLKMDYAERLLTNAVQASMAIHQLHVPDDMAKEYEQLDIAMNALLSRLREYSNEQRRQFRNAVELKPQAEPEN